MEFRTPIVTDSTLTRTVVRYVPWSASLTGGYPTGYAAYDALAQRDDLVPMHVVHAMAPQYNTAKVELNIAMLDAMPWEWQAFVGRDDRLVLASDVDSADRVGIFNGFIVEPSWTTGKTGARVILSAVGAAFRILRDSDYMVYGRYMLRKDGEVDLFTGLHCEFNAGGKPNRAKKLTKKFADAAPNTTRDGVPVFTFDGDPEAVWWTPADIFDYLQWAYNTDQRWIANWVFTSSDYQGQDPVIVSTEGMGLWMALAMVSDRSGHDVFEDYVNASGEIQSRIHIRKRNTDPAWPALHQAPGVTRDKDPLLDLSMTNIFSADVSESTSSCCCEPIVAGGVELYQIRMKLQRAWDPSLLSLPSDCMAFPLDLPRVAWTEYQERYCIGGKKFSQYANVGRYWDANTDGLFAKAPFSLSVPDMADLCKQDAGSWPLMRFDPLPMLSKLAMMGGPDSPVLLEMDFGDGNPMLLSNYKLLPDRLGVYIDVEDLCSIIGPNKYDPSDNFFTRLLAGTLDLYLTCTIAGPNRNVRAFKMRSTAGTAFPQSEWFDRSAIAAVKTDLTDSNSAVTDTTKKSDMDVQLGKVATAIQDASEGRSVEASLPIEWPDETVQMGDLIPRIGGINYPLCTNMGSARRYPRVVQATYYLTSDTWSMAIQLDTDRKSGMALALAGQLSPWKLYDAHKSGAIVQAGPDVVDQRPTLFSHTGTGLPADAFDLRKFSDSPEGRK